MKKEVTTTTIMEFNTVEKTVFDVVIQKLKKHIFIYCTVTFTVSKFLEPFREPIDMLPTKGSCASTVVQLGQSDLAGKPTDD